MGTRRKSRELALQMLFQHDLSGNSPEAIIGSFDELARVRGSARQFAERLFRGTLDHVDEIDDLIRQQADNWRLSRMAVVDRNILRMSLFELRFLKETPPLVIVDEAIEIAKRFGNERSSQFVNGILDGILKRYNPEETTRAER